MKVAVKTDTGLITLELDEVDFIEIQKHDKYETDSVFVRISFGPENRWTLGMDMDEAIHLLDAYLNQKELNRALECLVQWRMENL